MHLRPMLLAAASTLTLIPTALAAQAGTPVEPAANPLSSATATTQAPVAAGITASPADASASDAASNGGDIVVTAQRRNESLQRTPLAITAFTGGTLAARGVVTAAGLQAQVPGIQIAPQVFGNLQVFLRGVGSTANMPSGDPAIAFNVDGVYVARTNALSGLLFDLDRIEVVKGPQGTLYGRNATGGAINIITTKPSFDGVSGYVAADLGNYRSVQTEGAVNVPLSDTIAMRASFKTARHDGYLKVVDGPSGTVGNDRQDQEDVAGRLQLLMKPTERLSILLSGDYTHQGGAGAGEQLLPLTTGDPRRVVARQRVGIDNSFANGSITTDYDFGFAKLTYIGAFRYSDNDRAYEYPLSTYPGFLKQTNHQWTHEMRLGGQAGRLTWLVGGYHFYERTNFDLRLQITPTLWQHLQQDPAKSISSAAFGQATYTLAEGLRLTGGLRYTHDKKTSTGDTRLETAAGALVRISTIDIASNTWSSTNWKAGVEYDVAPHTLAYATASTAYKAGGYYGGSAPNTYAPEHLRSYEIGLKNRLFDNRLTLNLAAYYYDYTDLQVTSLDSDGSTLRTVTRNAGSATIKGFEAETAYNSENYGRFDGSLAYVNAHYDTFILPFGDSFTNFGRTTTSPANYSGNRLPLAPRWSFNAGYQYDVPVWRGVVTGRVQTHYESGKFLDFHQFPIDYQKSWTKTDVTLTYQPNGARWSFQAYVRNIENKAVLTTAIPPVAGNPIFAQAFYAPPRLYGGRFSLNF